MAGSELAGTFARCRGGNQRGMLAVAIGAIAVGIVFLFVLPWVGIPVGLVGLVLLGIWLIAVARKSPRAAAEETRSR
jgi:Flp pilus assembly protein TadB